MTAPRRLAAILAADVAGYSRLMAADEAGTLARFKLLRADHVEPAVRRHNGRVVGEAGDSLLVEFATASEAVTCALEVQGKLATLNAELTEDRRMQFRMGVNLGEVIVDGATIHGDGVNVAARLEKLAQPGGIVVSHAVREQAKGRVACAFEDLGEMTLHNIAEPVRAYGISPVLPTEARPSLGEDSARWQQSIAVLPFVNMSGDPEQEYFSDGITEDLITALAKARHRSVIARNSTFLYKGRSVKVQDIKRELGARYVVEGSVRKGGNRVRVTAQLIDAETGAHLWAERFDRELADIFAVQDEIVAAIVGRMGPSLVDAAVRHRGTSMASLTAYDHVLRGWSAWRRGAVVETWDHYLKAVEANPDSAVALACVAFLYAEDRFMQVTGVPIDQATQLAHDFAERAIAKNDDDPAVHNMLGAAFWDLGELDKAKHHAELAVSQNPHDPSAALILGLVVAFMGEHREGLAIAERALWLDPRVAPALLAVPLFIHCLMGN